MFKGETGPGPPALQQNRPGVQESLPPSLITAAAAAEAQSWRPDCQGNLQLSTMEQLFIPISSCQPGWGEGGVEVINDGL